MNKLFFPLFLFLIFPAANIARAEIVTETVEYKQGDTVLEGYLAYDNAVSVKKPGIIIIHEWNGPNDYTRSRARQLAELGYVGFAADIYGKGVRPEEHEEAAKISGVYRNDRDLLRKRGEAAFEFLKSKVFVNQEKIAAIGYCFGGMTVLEMARAGFDLKGVASFHGFLNTPVPASRGDIKARVIIFHGADDKFIPEEEIKNFQEEMRKSGTDWEMISFGGAVHRFTIPSAGADPSKGMAYNEKADKRSWVMLLDFLKEIFQQ